MGNQSLVTLPPNLGSYVKRDRFWPPRDREDNVIPHRIESIGLLKAVPHVLAFFNIRVPSEFWTEGVDGDGAIITIACKCGAEPVLRFGLRSYSMAECECGRFFMHDGSDIRVGYDPEKLPRPDVPPAEEQEHPADRRRREIIAGDLAWQP